MLDSLLEKRKGKKYFFVFEMYEYLYCLRKYTKIPYAKMVRVPLVSGFRIKVWYVYT